MRRLSRLCMLGFALLAAILGGLAWWAGSDDARHRFERLASDTLGREVRVRDLEVGWGALTLHGLTLADPWAQTPALSVRRARFEVDAGSLLRGGLVGTLRAETFSLDVRKRGETTNLHGIRRPRSGSRRLDITLELRGGEVRMADEDLGAAVAFEEVSVSGRVQRADAQPAVTLTAAADVVRGHGVDVHAVSAVVRLDAEGAQIDTLSMRLGEGTIEGQARVGFAANTPWSATLEARDLGLRDELLPIVVAVFPAAVGLQSSPEGEIAGVLSLDAEVRGEGLSIERARQTAEGRLSVRLCDVILPKETAAVRIAALFGRPASPLRLPPVDVEASLRGPWVAVQGVRLGGEPVALPFEGRVALDGRLDLEVDVLPLLQVFHGAPDPARGRLGRAPIRISGTTDAPTLQPPAIGSVARVVGEVWLEQALD